MTLVCLYGTVSCLCLVSGFVYKFNFSHINTTLGALPVGSYLGGDGGAIWTAGTNDSSVGSNLSEIL